MRPLPLLGLVAGLAMLGWGGWSLYARFAGPDVSWGPEKVAFLDELGRTLDEMRAIVQKEWEEIVDLRQQFARLKAGAEKDAIGKRIDETTADRLAHTNVFELRRAKLIKVHFHIGEGSPNHDTMPCTLSENGFLRARGIIAGFAVR